MTFKQLNVIFLGAISSSPLQSYVLKMVFSKPQKELPTVALLVQEKIHFSPQGFSFRSGLGVYDYKDNLLKIIVLILYL